MACIIYKGNQYTEEQFAQLLFNGELEELAAQRKTTVPITDFQKGITTAVNRINELFNRKLRIEQVKYRQALNSYPDLVKVKNFFSRNPSKIDISNEDLIKELKLDRNTNIGKVKFDLVQINKRFKEVEQALQNEKNLQLQIALGEPVVVQDRPSLKRALRNLFNLKKVYKTPTTTVSQDEAAAVILDKVFNTIAKRQSKEKAKPVKISEVYRNTFFKNSTPQEVTNALNQLIGPKGISNITVQDGETFIDIAGNTRYDLSDLDAKFNFDIYTPAQVRDVVNQLNQGMPLKNLLFHERLFQAYPQLANMQVKMQSFKDNANRGAYVPKDIIFNPETSSIILNNKNFNGTEITNLSETFSTLLHEIQHAIQHIEKFDMGMSPQDYEKIIKNAIAATKLLIDLSEEAQDKNVSLNTLITDDTISILEDGLFNIDNLDAIPDDEFINSMEENLDKLSQINKRDIRKMYQNSMGELEAIVTESRLLLDEDMEKVISFQDMMESTASVLDSTSPIYKDYLDAIFAVLDTKKSSPVLYQNNLNKPIPEAAAAYQSAGTYYKGSVEFDTLNEMQDIIHAITDPNVSSPLHEVAHKYERYLTQKEKDEVIKSYNDNNKDNPTTTWTIDVSEHFARGFEKYIQTGESPSILLNNIFAAFKQWLTDIYKGILYQNIDIDLNDQMKKIYVNMIGEDYVPVLRKEAAIEYEQTPPTNLSTIPVQQTEFTSPEPVITQEPIVTEPKIKIGDILIRNAKDNGKYNFWDEVEVTNIEDTPLADADDIRLNKTPRIVTFQSLDNGDVGQFRLNLLEEQLDQTEQQIEERGAPYSFKIKEQNEDQQITNTESTAIDGSNEGLETKNPTLENNPEIEGTDLIPQIEDEPLIIPQEEEEEEELPIVEPDTNDGFEVGDQAVVNDTPVTIQSFTSIGDNSYAITTDGVKKSSELRRAAPTKATAEKKVLDEMAVRKYDENPPKEGDYVLFENKEYIVGYTRSGELYLKSEDGELQFPKLSEIIESPRQKEERLKVKGEATAKKNALYAVAMKMQEVFPSIKFEIGEYEWEAAGKFSKGIVYINSKYADLSTPIHEFLHPFVFVLRKENKELFDTLIQKLKDNGSYQKQLGRIKSSGAYDNESKEDIDEEIVVREMTPIIRKVINPDGTINDIQKEVVLQKYGSFIMRVIQAIRKYITQFLGETASSFGVGRSKAKGIYLEDLKTFEYDREKGRLYVFGKNQAKEKVNVVVGNYDTINTEDALFALSVAFPKESPSTFEQILDILQNKLSVTKDTIVTSSTEDPEIKALFGGLTAEGINKSDVDFETVDTTFLQTLSADTSLGQLASFISFHGLYTISLNKHQKTFETLSDKLYVRSKDDLVKFAENFKKSLINLQHTLESRLKSSVLTEDMKRRVSRDLSTIKPILESTVTDENYIVLATDLVRSGFVSLAVADEMMSKIRTKVKIGDIRNYISLLEENLLNEGVRIIYKPNNFYGIRITKDGVELNKQRLIQKGVIPQDISKYISSKGLDKDDLRKRIQAVQNKTLNSLRTELNQEEIQDLNWQIMQLRNYYATFKGFTKPLLDEYLDKLDYTEVMEFQEALQRQSDRMRELENHMRFLAVEWLYPYFDNLQKIALQKLSKENYDKEYKSKDQFAKLLKYANEDNNAFDHLFGTLVNSKDPVNTTVAQIIVDKINTNEKELGTLVSDIFDIRSKYFDSKGIKTSAERAEYIKNNFLRKVKVKEEKRDEFNNIVKIDGKIQYDFVERWAFHTEYLEDKYDIALDEYLKTNPEVPLPIGGDVHAWDDYQDLKEKRRKEIKEWEDKNRPNFKDPEFQRLQSDEMFMFLYSRYEKSNSRYGDAKLRMGIIPQAYKQPTLVQKLKDKIEDIKAFLGRIPDKNAPRKNKVGGSLKGAANYLLNADDKVFYEQANPDETIYRSIKTQYLRPLEEDELNFDLTDTITAFTEDALKYSALRDIQSNIENLRLLINGYAAEGLGIGGRKVPQLDSDGNLIWFSKARKPKSKQDANNRLNKELTQFIDDIFYGDKVKERTVRLWSSAQYKDKLAKANEMVSEGKTAQEIYNETTFYKNEKGRWQTDVYQHVSLNINKVANAFTFYTSANSLAFNVMSTARNLSIGNFMNFSEAYGGKYFKPQHYLKAQGIYASNIPQNAVDLGKNRKSKLNQILFDFQAIQGEFRDRYNKITTDEAAIARLFSKDSLFFLQHVAEHQIQGTATIALMLNTEVKTKDGKTTNLWDAYELNTKGTLELKSDIDPSSFNQTQFIKSLHEMNRSNHGNYSGLHKTVIQREWYGALFMTFRKHMYPTLKARFGKRQIDYSKGSEIEGFHRVFFRKLVNDILTYKANITKYETFAKDKTGKGWTEEEVYSFRRSLFETLIGMVGMMALTFMLAGDDDDDDTVVKKWVQTVTNGLYTDLAITNPMGIINPFTGQSEVYQEFKKMSSNPVAVQYTYKKIADYFGSLSDEDKDSVEKAKKLIPILRHIEAISNPNDYVEGYLKYASLIGEGADK